MLGCIEGMLHIHLNKVREQEVRQRTKRKGGREEQPSSSEISQGLYRVKVQWMQTFEGFLCTSKALSPNT